MDVCDEVMEKMNYPKGLVRYTTQHALEGVKTHVLRPRMAVYGMLLFLITVALIYSMITRMPLELDIIRDRNALYRETNEGLIENIYTLRIINMDRKDHAYRLSVSGIDNMKLLLENDAEIPIKSGEVVTIPLRLQVDPAELTKVGYDVNFDLIATDDETLHVEETGRFIGPIPR